MAQDGRAHDDANICKKKGGKEDRCNLLHRSMRIDKENLSPDWTPVNGSNFADAAMTYLKVAVKHNFQIFIIFLTKGIIYAIFKKQRCPHSDSNRERNG